MKEFQYKILKSLQNELIHKELKNIKQLKEIKEYRIYFWPDGLHPNRRGHKFLFNYICGTLNI
jgi:hypothetical protein